MGDEAFDRIYEAGAQSGHSERIAELEAALAASAARVEAKDRDIGHLIAIIRFMEEATGESMGAEDAALVYQIERGRAAIAASGARIAALTGALQRIADRFQKNGEDLHGFINATRDIARAALDAAPRSDGEKP